MGLFDKFKKKAGVVALLALCLFSLSWCHNPQHDFTLYERFNEAGTKDMFSVDCDWESVNPLLESGKYEECGFQPFIHPFAEQEELCNNVAAYADIQVDDGHGKRADRRVTVTYGAIECVGQFYGRVRWFTEPMIEVYLYNPDAYPDELEPEYITGYRAVYSLDGELALEEGAWFLVEDKDEFCRMYFEAMLKAIGKDEGAKP